MCHGRDKEKQLNRKEDMCHGRDKEKQMDDNKRRKVFFSIQNTVQRTYSVIFFVYYYASCLACTIQVRTTNINSTCSTVLVFVFLSMGRTCRTLGLLRFVHSECFQNNLLNCDTCSMSVILFVTGRLVIISHYLFYQFCGFQSSFVSSLCSSSSERFRAFLIMTRVMCTHQYRNSDLCKMYVQ